MEPSLAVLMGCFAILASVVIARTTRHHTARLSANVAARHESDRASLRLDERIVADYNRAHPYHIQALTIDEVPASWARDHRLWLITRVLA
jgi:hypothetical protein